MKTIIVPAFYALYKKWPEWRAIPAGPLGFVGCDFGYCLYRCENCRPVKLESFSQDLQEIQKLQEEIEKNESE